MTTPALAASHSAARDYLELTKPRITFMVVLTAFMGFTMASSRVLRIDLLLAALAGTALVAGGASALNMLMERDTDALMMRTRQRPLPSGRLAPGEVLAFGLLLTVLGLSVLSLGCGIVPAAVALLTWGSYLFWYTPLKTRTSLATIVGAFPGALPPVIGWAAARGTVDPVSFVLFAILFLWQIPHFLAIAWIYREDYRLGGLPMLPVLDREGHLTGRQAVANSLGLLLVSLMPTAVGLAGRSYFAGALVLGVAFVSMAMWAAIARTPNAARSLFLASVLYLATLCGLLVFDRL